MATEAALAPLEVAVVAEWAATEVPSLGVGAELVSEPPAEVARLVRALRDLQVSYRVAPPGAPAPADSAPVAPSLAVESEA